MKKSYLLAILPVIVVACSENPTQPDASSLRAPNLTVLTPPGVNLLSCFAGSDDPSAVPNYGGTCTLSADHKKATLANTSGDADGDFSGVYSIDPASFPIYGELLSNITELSYTYKSLNVPALAPTPGVLIYEIPIDTNNDALFDFWAFVDASTCGVKSGATVNIVKMDKCAIVDGSPPLHAQPYANWADFVAAYPDARVTNSHEYITIISARVLTAGPNSWLISNVKFGKTGLICFDGPSDGPVYGGACTLGDDFKTATLDNLDFDTDGGYAGVFSRETTGYGLFLSAIKDLYLKYSGLGAPEAGELRYEIPISINIFGSTDFIAVVDFAACPGTVAANGVRTVNITTSVACEIKKGITTYPNWAAFAAAWPNAKTATDHSSTSRANWIMLISQRQFDGDATRWNVLDVKWGAKK
jgi:hypothetical protein